MNRHLPKSEWGPGPWQDEPDFAAWHHSGFVCFAVRNMDVTGSWCGYAGVTAAHPFWGKNYHECAIGCEPKPEPAPPKPGEPFYELHEKWSNSSLHKRFDIPHYECGHTPEDVIRVHGGLTWANPIGSLVMPEAVKVAHPDLWLFGFDCGHAFDLSPQMDALMRRIMPAWHTLEKDHRQAMRAGTDYSEVYRDLAYVTEEVNNMAAQLALVASVDALKARGSGHEQ